MKVTTTPVRPLLLGAALVAAASLGAPAPAGAAEGKQTVSAKLAKPLKEAQDDIKSKKYDEAIAKLKEASGAAGKTPYDQHIINEMMGFAYYKTKNYTEAEKAWEAEVDDGFTADSDKQEKIRALATLSYQDKNYDKAIEFGQRAIKGGFANEDVRTIVGQAYYLKGDWKNTLKFEEAIADNQIKGGETPKSETLQLILSACVKLNDTGCETRALEHLVAYYPKPDYWAQLLYTLRQQTSGSEADLLQTYRLMSEVDVLKSGDDYTEMAQLALDAGSPGEAQHILEKAFAKNVFTDQRTKERNQRLLEKAKQAAKNDQASLPRQEKEADAAANGQKNYAVGLAYLGYDQFDKAADELSKGLSKGGVKDQAQAQLLLGIAQLKAGHKDDAVKSFHAVKGDPSLERLASLWSLHAKQGSGPPPAAAAR
jgi:tetratricopeptide (TPR) repeat protein